MVPPLSTSQARTLKNLGLALLFSGFALELGGAITDRRFLFQGGIFIFLAGILLLMAGIFLGRKKP